MNAAFADTSFLLALLLTRDAHYQRARAWQRRTTGEVVTTEYVLLEFADALCAESVRRAAADALRAFRSAGETRVIPGSSRLFDEGLGLFVSRPDKRWSLTDCTSFIVMRREGITDALTSDRHFEQAGFRALLRSDPA